MARSESQTRHGASAASKASQAADAGAGALLGGGTGQSCCCPVMMPMARWRRTKVAPRRRMAPAQLAARQWLVARQRQMARSRWVAPRRTPAASAAAAPSPCSCRSPPLNGPRSRVPRHRWDDRLAQSESAIPIRRLVAGREAERASRLPTQPNFVETADRSSSRGTSAAARLPAPSRDQTAVFSATRSVAISRRWKEPG